MDNILEINSLCKSFNKHCVLDNINLCVKKGEVLAIIGPSGSGKTTLIRCINFLEIPDSGLIKFKNNIIFDNGLKNVELTKIRQDIGIVFQSLNLWPHKTVLGNIIEAPVLLGKLTKQKAINKACSLLEEMQVLEKKDEFSYNLSGGQQQRIAICRALIMEPSILLFDEITSALDPELVGEVLGIITKLAKGGQTMIIITHEISFAREVASRVLFLDKGKFIEEGTPDEVLISPKNARTKEFLSRIIYSKKEII